MALITDPTDISDPYLRQLGLRATWLTELESIIPHLDYLTEGDLDPSIGDMHTPGGEEAVGLGQSTTVDNPQNSDPIETNELSPRSIAFAKGILIERLEEDRTLLAGDLDRWLRGRIGRWENLWTEVISPWRTPNQCWQTLTPAWIRTIGTDDVIERYQRVIATNQVSVVAADSQTAFGPLVPTDLDHPILRMFGHFAAWVAVFRAASDQVMDHRSDGSGWPSDEAFSVSDEDFGFPADYPPWEAESTETEGDPIEELHAETSQHLEDALIAWLEADPEHWSIFNMLIIHPWEQEPGTLLLDRPGWVQELTSEALVAYFQRHAFSVQRAPQPSGESSSAASNNPEAD